MNSGIHAIGHTSPLKVYNENKRRKKFFDDRKGFVWVFQKLYLTDVDELQVNNSSHTKGTYV